MANLQVGLELLIIGMVFVFSVLLLLMVITIVMSKLMRKIPQSSMSAREKVGARDSSLLEEELAVVAAVIAPFVQSAGACNVTIREAK